MSSFQAPEFVDLIERFKQIVDEPKSTHGVCSTRKSMPRSGTESDDLERIRTLLTQFDELSRQAGEPSKPSVHEVSGLLRSFENAWSHQLEHDSVAPPTINIWQVARFGRNEVRHCRVLKWFLDPNASHCQGRRFLQCFLEVIGEPELIAESEPVTVRREVTLATGDSRLDIVMETRQVLICIEAKIGAPQSEAQVGRYYELVESLGMLHGRCFIGKLLTISGQNGEQVSDGFTRLLWTDVAKMLDLFAGRRTELTRLAARSEFVRNLAAQYADFLTSHIASLKG